MGSSRTAWHPLFASLLLERAPPSFEVQAEVPLTLEPQRADVLLLRRHAERSLDAQAHVLRALWPRIECDALVEFKSRARPLRSRDLARLVGYGYQYFAAENKRLSSVGHVHLVLVVTQTTPTLADELKTLGLRRLPASRGARGYVEVQGRVAFPLTVIELAEVADDEKDDLLRLFVQAKLATREARKWLEEHSMQRSPDAVSLEELEGFDEIDQAFLDSLSNERRERWLAKMPLEQRLVGLPPEQRLAGLPPEQRLHALTFEEHLLAMPIEALRALSVDYLATLPDELRRRLQQRLDQER